MKAEVIIVKYNNPKVEKPCVDSVIKHTKYPYHLTVYDNYPDNENIGKLWNSLIRRSDADYICLLNSDTTVTDSWLTKLIEPFDDKKSLIGAVGPTTNTSKNHQSMEQATLDYELIDFTKEYPGEVLSGFCLVFPRNVHNIVGGFPEDFGFYGQEVAFLDVIATLDYKQMWRRDVFVWHEGSATVKKRTLEGDFDELKERRVARDMFNKLRKKLGLKQV